MIGAKAELVKRLQQQKVLVGTETNLNGLHFGEFNAVIVDRVHQVVDVQIAIGMQAKALVRIVLVQLELPTMHRM